MSTHCTFELSGRRYGTGHRTYAKIECGFCHHVEWHVAKDSGVAIRVFRSHGWKVGNKPPQHRCPLCFTKAKASRRKPDNPAIPPDVGAKLKEKILNGQLRDKLLRGSVLHPEGPHAMPRATEDRSDEAPPILTGDEQVIIIVTEPPLKPVRGQTSTPGRTMFPNRKAAASAGVRATGSVDGMAFFTVPLGDGWTYKLHVNTTEAERTEWRKDRKYGPRPMKRAPDSKLGPKPVAAPPIPTKELHGATPSAADDDMRKPVTLPPGLQAHLNSITKKDPMTPTPTIAADRQPTRDERQLIHDELTKSYNIVEQRYDKGDTDALVASRLDLPRAWVTDLRTMFFGDHDRNEQHEAQKKDLDAAIRQASAAFDKLMLLANDAEIIGAELRALRAKLGV
jgi:hypothetical protein